MCPCCPTHTYCAARVVESAFWPVYHSLPHALHLQLCKLRLKAIAGQKLSLSCQLDGLLGFVWTYNSCMLCACFRLSPSLCRTFLGMDEIVNNYMYYSTSAGLQVIFVIPSRVFANWYCGPVLNFKHSIFAQKIQVKEYLHWITNAPSQCPTRLRFYRSKPEF